jgi:hypothetical protein
MYPPQFENDWAKGEADRKRVAYRRWLLNRSSDADVQRSLRLYEARLRGKRAV